jgi:hypothetical protein
VIAALTHAKGWTALSTGLRLALAPSCISAAFGKSINDGGEVAREDVS